MATVSNNGKYIKTQCNVWYDPKSDTIHVTIDDRDFVGSNSTGMHLHARRGTRNDSNARAALAINGVTI